ncbi:MAG: reverse transcriptase domain-containing protein, partial [Sedimenticola sp.]
PQYVDSHQMPTVGVHSDGTAYSEDTYSIHNVLDREFTFLDPNHFIAGNLHSRIPQWRRIITDDTCEAFQWIKHKVDIFQFMSHFTGQFKGATYDHSFPPSRHFTNAPICKGFTEFINAELCSRIQSGAISYLGKVGSMDPPYLVSPITIEPLKPRLCINLMYLNLFMKDTPFALDTLADVPKVVNSSAYMTKLDDKSGFDNVFMTESSRKLLCFEWGGYYFCCNTLPFGWKNSAYVYQTLNYVAMSHLRDQSVSGLLYIDDRLLEEYNGQVPEIMDNPYTRAQLAIKLAVHVLVTLGYFININKSVLIPTQTITFLGMIVDSVQGSFFVTEARKSKLQNIRDHILACKTIPLVTLQKFVGMCISLSLAIPAAKLYTSVCNRAIARSAKFASFMVTVDSDLHEEISHWLFLDDWQTPYPWLPERHFTLNISSDSSGYKWAAVYHSDDGDIAFSDFWPDEKKHLPIMIKEALALQYALSSLGSLISNKRVSAQVDNMALMYAWQNQYSKNAELNDILKVIFKLIFENNSSLSLSYISTHDNPSDLPSRSLSKSDATISIRTWLFIQHMFGPHTVDMFSLDSNAMQDGRGKRLKHFTPYPSPLTDGVDAFAQRVSGQELYYAFPPFCLIPVTIRFIIQERITCTLVFPDFHPHPPWYNTVIRHASHVLPVGFENDKGVLLYPSKAGFLADKQGLHWNLLAAHFSPCSPTGATYLFRTHSFQRSLNHTPVLFIGDSMIRFLEHRFDNTLVMSLGGGKMCDTFGLLCKEVRDRHMFVVILHSGTNDINKHHIPEHVQLLRAQMSIDSVTKNVRRLQREHNFAMVFSGCIFTRSPIVNRRVNILNSSIKHACELHGFTYIDNSNIGMHMLRDNVHLNAVGCKTMENNLKGFL